MKDGLNAVIFMLSLDENIVGEDVVIRLESDEIRAKIQAALERVAVDWRGFSINEK